MRGRAKPVRAALPLILIIGLAGCAGGAAHAPDPAPQESAAPAATVVISTGACGKGWTDPAPGRQTFQLHNTDTRPGEAYLVDAATDGVVAEVEDLGPGTTTPLTVDLGGGSYQFECAMEDADVARGEKASVAGPASRTTAVRPVSMQDLIPAAKGYQHTFAVGFLV